MNRSKQQTKRPVFSEMIWETSGKWTLRTLQMCIRDRTCAAALLLGGVYLVARRVISPAIPVTYLATVALVSLLAGAYKDVTGEACDIFSMGGGTYARQMFGKGVAFGAGFPDQEDGRAHQANEFLDLRRFKLHAQICLEAMYRMLTAE